MIHDLDNIPVTVMRKAWADVGVSLTQAADFCGWDRDRLSRKLGFTKSHNGYKTHVSYEDAVKMIKDWNLDPIDYGV